MEQAGGDGAALCRRQQGVCSSTCLCSCLAQLPGLRFLLGISRRLPQLIDSVVAACAADVQALLLQQLWLSARRGTDWTSLCWLAGWLAG
jgi:hypothetical protein